MNRAEERILRSLKETRGLAFELAPLFVDHKPLLLLSGPMGSGKTQLTKFLLEELEAHDLASSPSFAIHNSYAVPGDRSLEHFDLFRIESESDLESTGFWDYLALLESSVVVEWADRLKELGLAELLPRNRLIIDIQLEINSDDSRRVLIAWRTPLAQP